MKILFCVPVFTDAGEVLLYDVYIDGVWQGSRRTFHQAVEAFA